MESDPKDRKKLRWWFWVVLFLPVFMAFAAPYIASALGARGLGALIDGQVWLFLPLNALCSMIAANVLVSSVSAFSRRASVVGTSICLFLMNICIAFAGCLVVNVVK